MQGFTFPLNFEFKISTLANDFTAKDANGKTIAYVKQKLFKFKEHVEVFSDETKSKLLFDINADKWLDFNTVYNFKSAEGTELGKVGRKGWASIWKAHYELYDAEGNQDLIINEEKPWVKVFDALCKEIPVLNMFTGYFFNPSYLIKRPDDTLVARYSKLKSFWGRKFQLDKIEEFEQGEELRILLGIMMMGLLERRRG